MPLPTLTWVARRSMARRKSRMGQKTSVSASARTRQSQRMAQPRPSHSPRTGRSNQGRNARCGEGGRTKQRHNHIHQGASCPTSSWRPSHISALRVCTSAFACSVAGVGVVVPNGAWSVMVRPLQLQAQAAAPTEALLTANGRCPGDRARTVHAVPCRSRIAMRPVHVKGSRLHARYRAAIGFPTAGAMC